MFIIDPTTISGKVRLRTPLQADALSGKYIFNNLQNTEPNLGIPKTVTENSPDPDGKRYLLLSNNSYSSSLCSVSAWRVWSYNSPTIATWSKENSIALGDDALPIRQECLVYNNYSQKINRFNSEGFFDNTFNVFSMSGIYLFDPTTIGDPGSATSLIVTNYGNVGVNTDSPNERLSINGNLSCNGTLSATELYILNRSFLGNSKIDETTVRGKLKLGDMDFTEVSFGSGGTYDTNLRRGGINTLQTDSNFICYSLSSVVPLTADNPKYDSVYTSTNANSANWNTAYNYATTYPAVTAVSYSPFNLIGTVNTNTPLFTVPVGRKFICTSFGGNIIEVASTSPAGTCTVGLINSSRDNSSTIATNFTPAAANIAAIDNTNIYGNVNSVAVSGGETVSLRLVDAPTGFTTLSAVMFASGILI